MKTLIDMTNCINDCENVFSFCIKDIVMFRQGEKKKGKF